MQIIQDFIQAGRRNRPGGKNGLKFITIHNTGNANRGAGAAAHAAYVKSAEAADLPVSWHYTIDEGVIYQHLPDTETAYHAGDGSGPGNTQSIGIEICENIDGNLLGATNNAVMLVAQLCRKYSIPVQNVVQHNRWSGKDCPYQLRRDKPYSWAEFLVKVGGLSSTSPNEATVINALADGIITDRAYWLGVLNGTIVANPAYIKIALDNAHKKIRGS